MRIRKSALRAAIGATLAGAAMLSSTSAQANCGSDGVIGEICMVGFNYCPRGTIPAEGQILPISQNQMLYSLYSTHYGGDGVSTFGVPNMSGRTPVGYGQGPGLMPVSMGTVRGREFIDDSDVLSAAGHTHTASYTSTGSNPVEVTVPVSSKTSGNAITPDAAHPYMAGTVGGPGSAAMWADAMEGSASVGGVTAGGGGGSGTVTVDPAGGNSNIMILPPQLGVKFCIVVDGVYPVRP